MCKPIYQHDCNDCIFLGQTIGNGHMFDLYAHKGNRPIRRDATVIARYGDRGEDYFSTIAQMARPDGHAELFIARALWYAKRPS